MPNNQGTLIAAPIMPFSPNDVFPTHYANLGAGGWHQAPDVATMIAIPTGLLVDGMPCWVSSTETLYQYSASTNSWSLFSVGTGGGTGGGTTTVAMTTVGMTLTTAIRTLLVNSPTACTIVLPTDALNTTFTIKNIGVGTAIITPSGTDQIELPGLVPLETSSSLMLLTTNSVDMVYYGQSWYLV